MTPVLEDIAQRLTEIAAERDMSGHSRDFADCPRCDESNTGDAIHHGWLMGMADAAIVAQSLIEYIDQLKEGGPSEA